MMPITRVVLHHLRATTDWTQAKDIADECSVTLGRVQERLAKMAEQGLLTRKHEKVSNTRHGGCRHFWLYRSTPLGASILAERIARGEKPMVRGPYKKKQSVVEPVYSTNPFEWQTGKRQTSFESTTGRKPTPTARQKIRL